MPRITSVGSSLVETRQAKIYAIHSSRCWDLYLLLAALVTFLGFISLRPAPALAGSPLFNLNPAVSLSGVMYSSAAWGDYDNDGDLDIVLTGQLTPSGPVMTEIYRNDAGLFTDINAGLVNVTRSVLAWGDYDNDGDLDISWQARPVLIS